MKRRIAAIVVGAISVAGFASGARAVDSSTESTNYWGCVGVRAIDHGVCIKNPLPERLPVPSSPSAPATPS